MRTVKTSLLALLLVSVSTLVVGCASEPMNQSSEDQAINQRAEQQIMRHDFRARTPSSVPH